jgi:hypothetical protein
MARKRLFAGEHEARGAKCRRLHGPDPQTTQAKLTTITFTRFSRYAEFSLDEKQFIALCAYLSVILSWGYNLPEHEFDRFILRYESFLHAAEPVAQGCQRPSYHHWFRTTTIVACTDRQSLEDELSDRTEPLCSLSTSTLSKIGDENPYTFLCTKTTLETLAQTLLADQKRNQLLNKIERLRR